MLPDIDLKLHTDDELVELVLLIEAERARRLKARLGPSLVDDLRWAIAGKRQDQSPPM